MPLIAATHAQHRWPLLRAALARGQTVTLTVHGRCMWPALRPGDRARVRSLRSGRAGSLLGRVVVCVHGDRCVAHRVVQVARDRDGATFVRCRGDLSLRMDAAVPVREVLGEVDCVDRGGRTTPVSRVASPITAVLARLRPLASWLQRRLRAPGPARAT
jgi:hypothetical protein